MLIVYAFKETENPGILFSMLIEEAIFDCSDASKYFAIGFRKKKCGMGIFKIRVFCRIEMVSLSSEQFGNVGRVAGVMVVSKVNKTA